MFYMEEDTVMFYCNVLHGGGYCNVLHGGGYCNVLHGGGYCNVLHGGGYCNVLHGGGYCNVLQYLINPVSPITKQKCYKVTKGSPEVKYEKVIDHKQTDAKW